MESVQLQGIALEYQERTSKPAWHVDGVSWTLPRKVAHVMSLKIDA